MAKKKDPTPTAEETNTVEQKPKRIRLHWVIAGTVLAGALAFFVMQSGEDAAPGTETDPATVDASAPPAPQDVLAQEMGQAPPPEGEVPPSDPQQAAAEEPMPIPPPVTSDSAPEPEAVPEMQTQAEPQPEPVAPPPPQPKAEKKSAKKETATKKYTLHVSRQGTKVPSGLNKDKVLSYLNKKLDGDKTCIPASLKKKEVKPFSVTVAVSKTGSITGVDMKPKLPQSKAITSCLKKKLSGNTALFKGKGKSASKITIALRVK